jgi:hypothetical protein
MTLHDSLTSTYAAMRRKGTARGTAAPRARAPEILHEHMHTDAESAYAAVRRSIAARENEQRRADEGAELLLEDDEAPEAPPRTGPRKGRERREYAAKRNYWRQQLLHIDENLLGAARALQDDDVEGFKDAFERALDDRVRDAVEGRKLEMMAQLCAPNHDEDEGD